MYRKSVLVLAAASLALLGGCSSGGGTSAADTVATAAEKVEQATADVTGTVAEKQAGIRLVSVESAKDLLADTTVTVLDFRTPDEYAGGHLERSAMIDFYEPDFRAKLADLDRAQKYLVYCRSGNRSGQAASMMKDLGFADVADLDGGVIAWEAAGESLIQ